MSRLERGPRGSEEGIKFWRWTGWDWARLLIKLTLGIILISIIYSTIIFWLVPSPKEYPGQVYNDEYPSSAIADISENFWLFFENYKLALLLHLASMNVLSLMSWVLQTIALTLTFFLPLKIYDVLLDDVVKIGPREYVNLAMGSILVGIILLTSSSRNMMVKDKLYIAITIGILTLVLFGLERVRKSILVRP